MLIHKSSPILWWKGFFSFFPLFHQLNYKKISLQTGEFQLTNL
ncbi:Hypothetical protein EUBREC_2734 [Agathobacter rectalis ATCC 33656]|uniref:Uncharacterized protein n=1 Tax=Agathobacter rectalis (strain ATCC 33656 / DSM 3377 / JCM 17463 / KCTC 5835 / VPI 0990) TaxID=515619 RepID=C4ZEN2_AGARV|nr:Hypothetical protein EUBREC_0762 [Agathobacter rectalis ATCC 33656]ACR76464.1 Hypothetical protein EUBREC_2734 [Agathobacter rectalis ATCC 33656]